jgi:hypothetical protein
MKCRYPRLLVRIYALVNPINDEIFYVGCTYCSLKTRLNNHIGGSWRNKKYYTIKSILRKGIKPEIFDIDVVPFVLSSFWERFYHDLFQSFGFELHQHKNFFNYYQMHNDKGINRYRWIEKLEINEDSIYY